MKSENAINKTTGLRNGLELFALACRILHRDHSTTLSGATMTDINRAITLSEFSPRLQGALVKIMLAQSRDERDHAMFDVENIMRDIFGASWTGEDE